MKNSNKTTRGAAGKTGVMGSGVAQALSQKASTETSTDAVALLRSDHRHVEQLFRQYESANDDGQKADIVKQIATALMVHTILEEEIFYPACRQKADKEDELDEAQVEHDSIKVFVEDVLNGSPDDEFFDAKITVLSEYVKHHVAEEEKEGDGIFAEAKKAGADMNALGTKLQARKSELMAHEEQVRSNPPAIRSLHIQQLQQPDQEYQGMARYSSDRERDENGRFMSDDDRGYSRGRSGYSRFNRDDDYGDRSGRERDENGRFMSEDNRSHGGGRSSGRGYDDDYDRGPSRGRGWSGDSEGHSRAASQRGYGSEDRYGSDYGSRSSHRDDNDDYDRGRSSQHHEHGGWYGDPRGHSEASRQGWEERGGGYRSRSRDDDERSSRGGSSGHGGWSGDPEGHAEAARRGWRNR